VQQRLDANPEAMRQRRETVGHPFGTMKARMGATHFVTKALPKVAAEMALSVLAYNLTRVMNILGIKPLIAAIAAKETCGSWLSGPTTLGTVFTRPRRRQSTLRNEVASAGGLFQCSTRISPVGT